MSGKSVRDLTVEDVMFHLQDHAAVYDDYDELSWNVSYTPKDGWVISAQDDGGDYREWYIRLGHAYPKNDERYAQ